MDLPYFEKLKNMQTEFASSQRKAFAIADVDEKNFYLCLNIFDNSENLEFQDKDFEFSKNIIRKNKLGTALISIISNFEEIENTIYEYINLCNNFEFDNSELFLETKIITPLFLSLGNKNIYFSFLKDFEYRLYKSELELFKKRKSNIVDFKNDFFEKASKNIDNKEQKTIFNDILETNNILKEYMETQTIKSFTIDYLKTYILEIRNILKLVDFYFDENSKYSKLDKDKKFFLFSVLINSSNNFIYPISKVEAKIKFENEYINIWNFEGNYLYKKSSNKSKGFEETIFDYVKEHDVKIFTTYRITNIKDLLNISFIEILKNNITIRKCKNCGEYFITENRTDEKYCNRKSPQNCNKTCKEYGAKKIYRDELKSIPLKNEHNKTSQFFRMRINRAETQKQKNLYTKQFDIYKKNYQKKKQQYKLKKLKEQDFIDWIINQKEKNLKPKNKKSNNL